MTTLDWLIVWLAIIAATAIAVGQLYEPVYLSPSDCNMVHTFDLAFDCSEPVDYVESTELVAFLVEWEEAFPEIVYYYDTDPNKFTVRNRRVCFPIKGRVLVKRGDPNDTPMMRWLKFWKEHHGLSE